MEWTEHQRYENKSNVKRKEMSQPLPPSLSLRMCGLDARSTPNPNETIRYERNRERTNRTRVRLIFFYVILPSLLSMEYR